MTAKRKGGKALAKRSAAKKLGHKPLAKSVHPKKGKRAGVAEATSARAYIVQRSGAARPTHVAAKGTARQITRTIGLSDQRLNDAKSLLQNLEQAGLIQKL